MDYVGDVMQHPTFCTKKLQKFCSMTIEAHMILHAVAENFNHCLFSLHLLDATVSTASSTSFTTAPPTSDGEFQSSSYSLVLICCCYNSFDPLYLHKFANKLLEVVVLFSIDDLTNLFQNALSARCCKPNMRMQCS